MNIENEVWEEEEEADIEETLPRWLWPITEWFTLRFSQFKLWLKPRKRTEWDDEFDRMIEEREWELSGNDGYDPLFHTDGDDK